MKKARGSCLGAVGICLLYLKEVWFLQGLKVEDQRMALEKIFVGKRIHAVASKCGDLCYEEN